MIVTQEAKEPYVFNFGFRPQRYCYLILRTTYTNVILTMLDCEFKVVTCVTGGKVSLSNSKRHKKAPQISEALVLFINHYLHLYELSNVKIHLKNFVPFFKNYFLKQLNYHLIDIYEFEHSYKIPHNGPRGRAVKRKGR